MGGEGVWEHVNSCLHHASNWTCAHDHVLRALESICNAADFATTHRRVLTSEGNCRADFEICNIRVAQQTYLLVDVTVRHDFIGAGHIGQYRQNQGKASSATPTTRITSSRAPLGCLLLGPDKDASSQCSMLKSHRGVDASERECAAGANNSWLTPFSLSPSFL